MVRRLDMTKADFEAAFASLLGSKRETDEDVTAVVARILADVAARGDAAVIELTKRFDHLELTPETMRITPGETARAYEGASAEMRAALDTAATRIESFHRRQLPADLFYTDDLGVGMGWRWRAVRAAGLYVPGGTASYPSSVLMNAIPARVAGVERIVMVVPASRGELNPLVLAAAHVAGVSEIYRIGGAQAVGALAYGTATIAPVDVIVGPGNAYVAAAKRLVYGRVGIDMIAGPSEVLVLADGANDPAWIAADLLAQAEHDASAQSILVTDDPAFADAVVAEVGRQLELLPRGEIAGASWRDFGAVILVPSLEAALPLVDALAPEHLEIAAEDADALAARVHNAGAIFIGRYTPEAIGDYVGGPNHVLPTARSARFASGLSVYDFLKRSSLLKCDAGSLRALSGAALTLAEAEGLGAHGRSIAIRLNL